MPPPPLTDEEVQRIVQSCWDEDRRHECLDLLGIAGVGLDEEADDDDLEAIVGAYQWEWERAWHYGLAEDTLALILAKLNAPSNPEMRLAEVLDREDIVRIQLLVHELCEGEHLRITIPLRRIPHPRIWIFPLFISCAMICWLIYFYSQESLWEVLGLVSLVLGYAGALIGRKDADPLEWQFEPRLTYAKLAEQIRVDAKSRAEEMQQAAQQYQQTK